MKNALEKAKITSIDTLTGRVGLYLRNGLNTVGTYLYDIKDLRVGMAVIVGRVSNAYVIFQNMASSSPAITTKSYGVSADQKTSIGFIDYFRDNLNPSYSDEFDGEEYTYAIDETKWNLTEDSKVASRLIPRYLLWYYWDAVLADRHGYPEFFKIWDSKLYLDKYNKVRAVAVLDNALWRSGNVDVELRTIIAAKLLFRPYWTYGGLSNISESNLGFFYPYGTTGRQEQLPSDDEDFSSIYFRFTRVGSIWTGYTKMNAGDAWTAITSGTGPTTDLKCAILFNQQCFSHTNTTFDSDLQVVFMVMDANFYNKTSGGCYMEHLHQGYPHYHFPDNGALLGVEGSDRVYLYSASNMYNAWANPDYL